MNIEGWIHDFFSRDKCYAKPDDIRKLVAALTQPPAADGKPKTVMEIFEADTVASNAALPDGWYTKITADSVLPFTVKDGVKTQGIPAEIHKKSQSFEAQQLREALAEVDRLTALLNTPEILDFVKAAHLEACHQRERWASEHDGEKGDADWFWLIGHLAAKAMHNPPKHDTPDRDVRLHRIITVAAAACNWHAATLAQPASGGGE